jgi:hypothetical protein
MASSSAFPCCCAMCPWVAYRTYTHTGSWVCVKTNATCYKVLAHFLALSLSFLVLHMSMLFPPLQVSCITYSSRHCFDGGCTLRSPCTVPYRDAVCCAVVVLLFTTRYARADGDIETWMNQRRNINPIPIPLCCCCQGILFYLLLLIVKISIGRMRDTSYTFYRLSEDNLFPLIHVALTFYITSSIHNSDIHLYDWWNWIEILKLKL